MDRYIEAAPKILRVVVEIFNNGNSKNFMWLNFFKIQGKIDLTHYAINKTIPLRYRLSSVIAHGGPGNNIEHSITEEQAFQMNEHGMDPENDETIRHKELREEEELMQWRLTQLEKLRDVLRIDIQDEAGWPARDMYPETMQHIDDFVVLGEVTEEDLTEMLNLEEEEGSLEDGLSEREFLTQEDPPEERTSCQLQREDSVIPDSEFIPASGSTQQTGAVEDSSSHYIITVKGPENSFHISDRHANIVGRARIKNNPQQPFDMCHRARGYQAYCLTYIRDTSPL